MVLFCFALIVLFGLQLSVRLWWPPGTAADTFRRVVEAPLSPPSSPVIERGALSIKDMGPELFLFSPVLRLLLLRLLLHAASAAAAARLLPPPRPPRLPSTLEF